jgi:hypothetical protein
VYNWNDKIATVTEAPLELLALPVAIHDIPTALRTCINLSKRKGSGVLGTRLSEG